MKIAIRYILLLSIISAILSLKHMPTRQRNVTKVDRVIPTTKNVTEVPKVEKKQKLNATLLKVNQTAHYRTLNVTASERKVNSTLLKQNSNKVSHKLLKNVTHVRKQENLTEEKPKVDIPKKEDIPSEPVKVDEKNITASNSTKTEEEEEKNKHWWIKAWEWVFGKSKSTKENKENDKSNNTTVTNSTTSEEKAKEESKKDETPKTEARKGNTLLKKRQ